MILNHANLAIESKKLKKPLTSYLLLTTYYLFNVAQYTIRKGFTITRGGSVYQEGQTVELSSVEFDLHKHKLEGTETTVVSIKSNKNSSSFPLPHIAKLNLSEIPLNIPTRLKIAGSYFTPDSTVAFSLGKVEETNFKSDNSLIALITALELGEGELTVTNSGGEVTLGVKVADLSQNLVDLREGGTEFPEQAYTANVTPIRTPEGMYFEGETPWSAFVRFEGVNGAWSWRRGDTSRTLSWIFNHSSSFMLGIGSSMTDEAASLQYSEAEILAHFQSGSFDGFYGNNGNLGNRARSTFFTSISLNPNPLKLTITGNGEPGSFFGIYQLNGSTVGDWFGSGDPIFEGEIPSLMTADEPNLMPFVIPRSISSVFLGFYWSDEPRI